MDKDKKIHWETLKKMIRDTRLTASERLLMVDILAYGGLDGDAFPSQRQLAKDMGYTDRHIRTCLDALLARGWLKGWEIIKGRRSNTYYPNEELYFRIEVNNRNYSSAQLGTTVPPMEGSIQPTKVSKLNKSIKVITNKYSSIDEISDTDIREIAEQYKVPIGLVQFQFEALKNYCASKGKRYKDYKAALKNFVMRGMERRIEKSYGDPTKRGIDARKL